MKGKYRLIRDDYDGWSSFHLYCCDGIVATHHGQMEAFKFCPLCATPLTGLVETRPQGFPKWAWVRGLEPKWPEPELRKYWEVQSRSIKPEDYDDYDPYDHFKWTTDFEGAWCGRGKKVKLDYIREAIKEKPLFWQKQFRLVFRDKAQIYQIYFRDWMRSFP